MKNSYPTIDTVHFFSDGPTTQYRQKKNFYLFSQIHDYGFIHATWSYFEAAHGKGAADGVGGAINGYENSSRHRHTRVVGVSE